jgi:NAD(P)H-quinone oxidoreductase subunit 5
VRQWRASHLVHHPRGSLWYLLGGTILVGIAVAPVYAATTSPTGHTSTIGLLALVLGLSFAPMIGRALAGGRRAFMIATLFTVGASAAYFGWHVAFEAIAPSIQPETASNTQWSIVVAGLAVLFVAQSLMQTRPNGWFSRWLQPHLLSGLYIDDWFTRVTFRLWPPGFR